MDSKQSQCGVRKEFSEREPQRVLKLRAGPVPSVRGVREGLRGAEVLRAEGQGLQ